MGFSITYSKLFEVRFLHHYFLDNGAVRYDDLPPEEKAAADKTYEVSRFLQVAPTTDCAQQLKNFGCLFRRTATGFAVFIKTRPQAGKLLPVTIPDGSVFFRFSLRFTDPYFKNYTSLPLKQAPGTVYFFTNKNKDATQIFPSLTQKPLPKDGAKKYDAGAILTDGAETVVAGKLTPDTLVQDFTIEPHIGGKAPQLVTGADAVSLTNGLINFTSVKTSAELEPVLKLTNGANQTVTPKQSLTTLTGGPDKTGVQLDLSRLPEDVYTVTSDTGSGQWIYTKEKAPVDAIIQISISAATTDYSLLDAQGFLAQPLFEIRLKNRSTAWRYLGAMLNGPADTGYKPMTAKGKIAVTLTDKNGKALTGMPNPDIGLVKPEPVLKNNAVFVDGDHNSYHNMYSEIYI